jgi:hypothetical protein
MTDENTINEIIIEKIKKMKADNNVKEIVIKILDLERQHMLIRYPRFSEDYDLIISRHMMGVKNDKNKESTC